MPVRDNIIGDYVQISKKEKRHIFVNRKINMCIS